MNAILVILLLNISGYNDDISIIRELYLEAYISESNCNDLGKELTSIGENASNLITGYEGCFYFIKCKFINSPINKFSYFNKGKKLLELAIKKDPKSVELKFLRYTIQKNIPKFLLYYDNIEKDLNFVNENIKNIKDRETQKFIMNSLKYIDK